jgi:hypothetical protein
MVLIVLKGDLVRALPLCAPVERRAREFEIELTRMDSQLSAQTGKAFLADWLTGCGSVES